ncbi:MAG: hypothetical protein Q9O74_06675 [Planctomycetota bacterium]|nr:hypothetical protein [Planctomycetota bacterium]
MNANQERSPSQAARTTRPGFMLGWLVGIGFFALAVVLLLTSGGTTTPSAPTAAFDPALIEVGPRRVVLTNPPTTRIGGFDQRCNACHQLFESEWDGQRPLVQHAHISLAHGINNRCDNCHARDDREQLSLHDGSTVSFDQTETLCAQCHGPVFRDWERGTHGKTLGAWDPSSPAARRLSCAECHDPHAPAFAPIEPLPGPNTLRMGDPLPPVGPHQSERNPLRRWNAGGHDEGEH